MTWNALAAAVLEGGPGVETHPEGLVGLLMRGAWLIPVLPLVALVLIIAVGKRLPARGWELAEGAMFLVAVYSVALLVASWINPIAYEQHIELAQSAESAIADRSIYEDAHIFARALYHLGNLSERDYQAYRLVFERVVSTLPSPDLLLFLQAPVSVLLDRIGERGRTMESGITADYLSLLETFYDDYILTED